MNNFEKEHVFHYYEICKLVGIDTFCCDFKIIAKSRATAILSLCKDDNLMQIRDLACISTINFIKVDNKGKIVHYELNPSQG